MFSQFPVLFVFFSSDYFFLLQSTIWIRIKEIKKKTPNSYIQRNQIQSSTPKTKNYVFIPSRAKISDHLLTECYYTERHRQKKQKFFSLVCEAKKENMCMKSTNQNKLIIPLHHLGNWNEKIETYIKALCIWCFLCLPSIINIFEFECRSW